MKLTDAQIRSVIVGHDADGNPHPIDQTSADALLARVLATPRDVPEGSPTPAPLATVSSITKPRPRRPRHLGRWVAMAAAAAVIGGVIVSTPSPQEAALANWTATPTRITDTEAARMMESCREQFLYPGPGPLMEGQPTRAEADAMDIVIADRRGKATFGILEGDGWMAECMAFDDLPWYVPARGPRVTGSSMVMRTPTTPVPADGLSDITCSGVGSSNGGEEQPDDPAFASLSGRVGEDVRDVVLHTPEGDVTATVASGWVAAWWPTTWRGVGKWAAGESSIRVPATLTLSDGSTREIADIGEFAWPVDPETGDRIPPGDGEADSR